MAFKITEILKGLLIKEENSTNPKQVEILPGGTAGTKTTIQASQTGNVTITLPNSSDTLATQSYVTSSSGAVNDLLDDHIADTTAAHAASAISTTSSNVQSDLNTISSTLTDLDSRLDTIESAVISDPVTKSYVDNQDATKLNLSGGTMTGNINIGANKLTSGTGEINFADGSIVLQPQDGSSISLTNNIDINAATGADITLTTSDTLTINADFLVLNTGIITTTNNINLQNAGKITNSEDPFNAYDLTTKNYVDNSDLILKSGITRLAASNWTQRTGIIDNDWRSITYGNGRYLAVAGSGAGNRVMFSPEGITWNSVAASEANEWNSVIYGYYGGLHTFIATAKSGSANRVMRSTNNGVTWSSISLPVASQTMSWNSVAFGNNIFIAVSSEGAVIKSVDGGATWVHISTAVTSGKVWNSVAFISASNKFIATGASNKTMYSNDYGDTWTLGTIPTSPGDWASIAYGNNRYVAIDKSYGYTMYSFNGTSWTLGPSIPYSLTSVVFSNGLFVATITDFYVYLSSDGINWTLARTGASNNFWQSIATNDQGFVAVSKFGSGDRVMTSLRM